MLIEKRGNGINNGSRYLSLSRRTDETEKQSMHFVLLSFPFLFHFFFFSFLSRVLKNLDPIRIAQNVSSEGEREASRVAEKEKTKKKGKKR